MPTWPAALPQKPMRGFTIAEADNLDRFQTTYGPDMTSVKSIAAGRTYSVTYIMAHAQVAAFRSFYEVDAAFGSIKFDMVGPDDCQSGEWLIASPPQYSSFGPKWAVSFDLYRYP